MSNDFLDDPMDTGTAVSIFEANNENITFPKNIKIMIIYSPSGQSSAIRAREVRQRRRNLMNAKSQEMCLKLVSCAGIVFFFLINLFFQHHCDMKTKEIKSCTMSHTT